MIVTKPQLFFKIKEDSNDNTKTIVNASIKWKEKFPNSIYVTNVCT